MKSDFLKAHHSHYIQINGTRVHYIKEGRGDPLILLHGGGTWMYTWRSNISELAQRFTVFAVDMPGFGLTTTEKPFMPTEDYYADFIKAFLDAQSLKSVYIVGSSWGGGWALRFAQRYPAYAKKLVLISTAGLFYHRLRRPTFLWNLITYPVIGRLVSRYAVTPSILMAQYKSLLAQPKSADKHAGRELYIGLQNPDNRRVLYEYGYRDMWQKTDKSLSKVTQPTLLIWGEQDKMFPVGDGHALAERLPQALLTVLPHAGHLPHEEQPAIVNQSIVAFLLSQDK